MAGQKSTLADEVRPQHDKAWDDHEAAKVAASATAENESEPKTERENQGRKKKTRTEGEERRPWSEQQAADLDSRFSTLNNMGKELWHRVGELRGLIQRADDSGLKETVKVLQETVDGLEELVHALSIKIKEAPEPSRLPKSEFVSWLSRTALA
jgi:predicted  nucleic acid-binding Zn-ribbon protein